MNNAKSLAFLTAVAFIAAACSDRTSTAPNAGAIQAWRDSQAKVTGPIVPGTCTTVAALNALSDQVFGAGGPNSNSVKSKIDQVDKANKKGDRSKANDAAFNAVRFIFQKFKGPQPLAGTPAQVAKLISDIFCFAGINITITDPANSNLIDPSASTQVVKSSDSTAGTQLPPGSIQEPTVLEFTKVPNSFTTPGAGPLNTKLDQYPGFYLIKAGSASGSGPQGTVTVAICPDASVPASVRGRLRLGHEKTSGFEITPPADASFLTCPAPTSLGAIGRVIDGVMSKLMPKQLYAAITQEEAFRGGVGGSATEFSPFDPIDPELTLRGGVGGSATEFKQTPTTPGTTVPTLPVEPGKRGSKTTTLKAAPGTTIANTVAPPCPVVEGFWDAPLDAACRPGLIIATHLGTPLANVPVSWLRVLGGGAIAAENPADRTCSGAFGSTVNNTTDATGRVGICWNLGTNLGTNTATATPSAGGDAPPGVTFLPVTNTFTATAIKVTPVVTTTGPDSVVYNGAPQMPWSASVTDAVHSTSLGAVPVAYGPTTPPRNVGTYTIDASYVGAAKYNPATAVQKPFRITQATPSVAITCTPSVDYTGSTLSPCSGTTTGVGSDGTLTPTPVVYTPATPSSVGNYTAVAYFAATQNYFGASSAVASFKIMGTPTVAINCPTGATYDGHPVPCTATVTGQPGGDVGVATITYSGGSTPINAGSYTVNANFAGSDLYHPAAATAVTLEIAKAATTTTVSCTAGAVYTSTPITPCSATVTGPELNQAVTPVTYSDNVNAGTATGAATYAGAANYLGSHGSATFTIAQATPTTSISCPAIVEFTGSALTPCTGTTTGVGTDGTLTPTGVVYTPATPNGVGHYTAVSYFAPTQNYLGVSSAPAAFKVMGTPAVSINCPAGVEYNGATQQPCTASVIGQGGGSVGAAGISYAGTPIDAGPYTVNAHFAGSDLYHPADAAPAAFTITKAPSATTVSCPVSIEATGSPLTPCSATATGVGGLNTGVSPVNYSNNVNPGTASASATFGGDANHTGSVGNASFTITAPPAPLGIWAASGPGSVTLLNSGSTGNPSMSYSLSGTAVWSSQTWTFSTVATSAGTFTPNYTYSGFHAWFMVYVYLKPFVIHGGVKTYVGGSVNQGPASCCGGPPSGGFNIAGGATFVVAAGDTYGFEMGGQNSDSDTRLLGTFTITP